MNLDMDIFWNSCKSYFVRLLSLLRFFACYSWFSFTRSSSNIIFWTDTKTSLPRSRLGLTKISWVSQYCFHLVFFLWQQTSHREIMPQTMNLCEAVNVFFFAEEILIKVGTWICWEDISFWRFRNALSYLFSLFLFTRFVMTTPKKFSLAYMQSSKSQVYPPKCACVIFSEEMLILAVEKLKNSRPFWSN